MAQTGKGVGVAASAGSPVGYTLTELKNICYYHGWQDKSTSGEAALTKFINRTLQLLAVLAPWPEYHKRDGRITLAEDDEDYVCTDDSDATLTNISKVGSVMRTDRMTPLDEMVGGIDEWMEKSKLKSQSGSPLEYTFRKYVDNNGLIRMEMLVYPKPGSGQVGDYLYYPYWLLPTQLVNGDDATDWPNYRLWLLEEALERRLASGKRDVSAVALESPEFLIHVQKAMADSRTSYMPIPLTSQVDLRHRTLRESPVEVTE